MFFIDKSRFNIILIILVKNFNPIKKVKERKENI